MNKFEVDRCVQKLLSLSKNKDDIDVQCLKAAKLYFEISEHGIAKEYIGKYLRYKSNSECGLVLKAKIHEALNEDVSALQCYEVLYNISNRKSYIMKVCECLLRYDAGQQVAKMWIDILEANYPDCDQLIKLKSRYYTAFKDLSKELEKLRHKMKNDSKNLFKKQYVSILEKIDNIEVSLEKCVEVLNVYDVLEDVDLVIGCVNIFRRALFYRENKTDLKQLYCVLLVALIRHDMVTDSENCPFHLKELYSLLLVNGDNQIDTELNAQFLYMLVSYGQHCAMIKGGVTEDISLCIYSGYITLRSFVEFETVGIDLKKRYLFWLHTQSILRRSVVNYMVHNVNESLEVKMFHPVWIKIIASLIWVSNDVDYEVLGNIVRNVTVNYADIPTIDEIIESDIACYSAGLPDFGLVMWHLFSHLHPSLKNESPDIDISMPASKFIHALLKTLFPRVQWSISHNRSPENISLVDIVTFFLGSLITLRKEIINTSSQFLLPFIFVPQLLATNSSLEKWWLSVCDFLINDKRNTCVGYMRENLKNGLKVVRCLDCTLSETLKLQLSRSLANFAKCNSLVEEVVLRRSVYFQVNAIESARGVSYGDSGSRVMNYLSPVTDFGHGKVSTICKEEHHNLSFTMDPVSDQVINSWRFQAFLSCIERQMKSNPMNDDWVWVEDLINNSENTNLNMAQLCFLKSKMFLARAGAMHRDDRDLEQFHNYLSLAIKHADKCGSHMNSLTQSKQHELRSLYEDQCSAISKLENMFPSPRSRKDGGDIDLSSNNSQVHISSQSTFCDESSNPITNFHSNEVCSIERIKQLELQVEQAEISNSHNGQNVHFCLTKCEDVRGTIRSDQTEIELLKSQAQMHNEIYLRQFSKIENLTRKFDRFKTIEEDYDCLKMENIMIKEQVRHLTKKVEELTQNNIVLKLGIDRFNRFPRRKTEAMNSIVQSQLSTLNDVMDFTFGNIVEFIRSNLNFHENMENKIIGKLLSENIEETNSRSNKKASSSFCPETVNGDFSLFSDTVKGHSNMIYEDDMNFFDDNQSNTWTCAVCLTKNDNTKSLCSACPRNKVHKGKKSEKSSKKENYMKDDLKNSNKSGDNFLDFDFGAPQRNTDLFRNNLSPHIITISARNSTNEEVTDQDGDESGNDDENDSDVIFVSETYVSEDQKKRARALLLPDHFYYFENLSEKDDLSSSDSESSEKNVRDIELGETKNFLKNVDLDYKSIEECSPFEIISRTDEWDYVFKGECKLFRNCNKVWIEHGVGDMMVMSHVTNGKLLGRLLMKRKSDGNICCNQRISNDCPTFRLMKNSTRWFADDFSRGSIPIKELFLVKFTLKNELKHFMTNVVQLQRQMEISAMTE